MGTVGKTHQGVIMSEDRNSTFLSWRSGLALSLLLVIFYLLPLFLADNWLNLITEMLIMALAGAALNLLLGDCGIISFGHAGFFAVGAYTFGLLLYYRLASFGAAFLLAIAGVILFSLIVGWFLIRLVEIYFSLLCLAFSQVVWVIVSVWYSVTGGDDGLNGIPIPGLLFSAGGSYYFVLTVVGVCLLLLFLIRESPFGYSLHAIRDNRKRSGFIGINQKLHIYIAIVISGLFCGIAGILLVVLLHAAFPGYASLTKSGDFLFVCLLGGMYHFSGPIVGSFLYILLHFIIHRYTEYWPIFLGTGLTVIAIFFRGGVVGFAMEKYQSYLFRGRTRNASADREPA